MDELVQLTEKPIAKEIYMLAGWHQWADAGSISSGLPQFLVEQTDARKIGEISPDNFYLFQLPGTHHFLRPEIQLKDGYRQELMSSVNEFYYTGNEEKGLVIFLGTEPHMNVDRYAAAFFDAVVALGVKRVVAVGGVYGAMPFNLDRNVSCVYSLPRLKAELEGYSVRFSDYEGGATIASYLLDRAERENLEFLALYSFVPAYDFAPPDFSDPETASVQGIRLENDFRAWYELMRRINHMFAMGLDLSELEKLTEELNSSVEAKIEELVQEMPETDVRAYLNQLQQEFEERPFMPLDDLWEQELGDLFADDEL
jgi:predicted ATP-grasp superfamily ATP-dependent carboligase